MAPKSRRIAVPNSLLFVRDPSLRDFPSIWDAAGIWATSTCIAVSCLPDSDGATDITLGAAHEVAPNDIPLFEGQLKTPTRTVIVEIVPGEKILETAVSNAETKVRVWTNGFLDTDLVVIGLE